MPSGRPIPSGPRAGRRRKPDPSLRHRTADAAIRGDRASIVGGEVRLRWPHGRGRRAAGRVPPHSLVNRHCWRPSAARRTPGHAGIFCRPCAPGSCQVCLVFGDWPGLDTSPRKADTAAKAARDSAKISERILKDVERAWVDVEYGVAGAFESLGWYRGVAQRARRKGQQLRKADIAHDLPVRVFVPHVFKNGGRTVARLTAVALKIECIAITDLPATPMYAADDIMPVNTLLIPQWHYDEMAKSPPLWADEVFDIVTDQRSLFVYGCVLYEDMLGEPHRSQFCMVCQFPEEPDHDGDFPPRLTVGGLPAYNHYD